MLDDHIPARMLPRLLLLPACLLQTAFMAAQTHSITEPTITTCSGVLHDSGGELLGYGSNESFTTVICPDQPGHLAQLIFFAFDLSTQGPVLDMLRIHDGDSPAAPLIGNYSEQQLYGQVITASPQNPGGCLTLVFTSGPDGTGNFAATLSCILSCVAPTASLTTALGDTARLCAGESLVLDGAASLAAPGELLAVWTWSMSGLAPWTTNIPLDTVTFTEPGAFMVRLQVRDSVGCTSMNTTTAVVLVSGGTSFIGTAVPEAACAGSEVVLSGHATLPPLTWSNGNTSSAGPPVVLPDGGGMLFSFPLTIDSADPNAIVTTPADLGDICLDLEHSYMGDLILDLECPNGQSVVLHQQGGGGTFLGDANDSGPGPGICWNYCFNTTPEHGTWAECSTNGPTPNVIATSQGTALAPGSYTPVQPLSNLVGCPINGEWTLYIADVLFIDDGYMCGWSIDLASPTDSSFIPLTPSLALDHPDSAYWSSPNGIVVNGATPSATAVPPTGGSYPLTFTVIDSYGCQHDTTMVLHALMEPVVDAGPDIDLCHGPEAFGGSVLSGTGDPCTYYLVLQALGGTGWGTPYIRCELNGVVSDHSIPPGLTSDTIPLTVTDSWPITLTYVQTQFYYPNKFRLLGPQLDTIYQSVLPVVPGVHFAGHVECEGSPNATLITWTPTLWLDDPEHPGTTVSPPASGWYVLSADYPDGTCPGAVDSVLVTLSTDSIGISWDPGSSMLCADDVSMALYSWYLNGGLFLSETLSCLHFPAYGPWSLVAEPATGCTHYSPTIWVCPEVEIGLADDAVTTTAGLGTYVWSFNGDVLSGITGHSAPFLGNGHYTVTITMPEGCVVSASIDAAVGIHALKGTAPALVIVPNPNTGSYRLLPNGWPTLPMLLEVTDMTGRTVERLRSGLLQDGLGFEIHHDLPPGLYMVTCTAGEHKVQAWMIVQ